MGKVVTRTEWMGTGSAARPIHRARCPVCGREAVFRYDSTGAAEVTACHHYRRTSCTPAARMEFDGDLADEFSAPI